MTHPTLDGMELPQLRDQLINSYGRLSELRLDEMATPKARIAVAVTFQDLDLALRQLGIDMNKH